MRFFAAASIMHYGTFFFTYIVSASVSTIAVSVLALRNRTIAGMHWFAGSLVLGLIKLVLQGFEGKIPPVLSSMVANELYLISFVMQFMGLRWFVLRPQTRRRWPVALLCLILASYTTCYCLQLPYTGNIINIPFVILCGISGWFLVRRGKRVVSKVSATILFADMLVSGYRAALTDLKYVQPWETVNADKDPRWLYSLAAMAFLATCMVMCELWYMVSELEMVLAEQARTDSLTGALNRRAMEEAALREASRSLRHGHPLCMIMLDIDHFKHINDRHGHAAGDMVLKALVKQIQNMLRRQDVLARTGGEEFTILLPDTQADEGVLAAERVRKAVESLEVEIENNVIQFTVSAGVAQLDSTSGGWEVMMREADAAMYEAKESGRNSVRPQTNTLSSEHLIENPA